MKSYLVLFYNRFACETQSFRTKAKDEKEAEKLFYNKYPKEQMYDCIESIVEL